MKLLMRLFKILLPFFTKIYHSSTNHILENTLRYDNLLFFSKIDTILSQKLALPSVQHDLMMG